MEHEVSIEIDRPIADVFTYTNEKVADWSLTVTASEPVDDSAESGTRVGTRVRVETQDRGRIMMFDGTITEWQPPTRSAIHMTGKSFDIDALYMFEDLGAGRTRVTQRSKVRMKGVMKVFMFLCGWMFNKAGCDAANKEFDSLKQHCEAELPAAR